MGKIYFYYTSSRPALELIQPHTSQVLEAFSPGIKRQGREDDHSPPSNAEVKSGGTIPPLPHTSSWHVLVNHAREQLYFSGYFSMIFLVIVIYFGYLEV
jgi:hypothetical protein